MRLWIAQGASTPSERATTNSCRLVISLLGSLFPGRPGPCEVATRRRPRLLLHRCTASFYGNASVAKQTCHRPSAKTSCVQQVGLEQYGRSTGLQLRTSCDCSPSTPQQGKSPACNCVPAVIINPSTPQHGRSTACNCVSRDTIASGIPAQYSQL